MLHLLRLSFASLAVAILVLVGCGAGRAPTDKDSEGASNLVGKPAPDIQGELIATGKAASLVDFKGKVVLLDFWAVWCGPCIATFPHLREWHRDYHDDGLVVLGVTRFYRRFGFDKKTGKLSPFNKTGKDKLTSGQTPEIELGMLKDFAHYHKLENPLMVVQDDGWRKAEKDYSIEGIPTAVVIDRQGVVRMVRVGAQEENVQDLHDEIRKLLGQK